MTQLLSCIMNVKQHCARKILAFTFFRELIVLQWDQDVSVSQTVEAWAQLVGHYGHESSVIETYRRMSKLAPHFVGSLVLNTDEDIDLDSKFCIDSHPLGDPILWSDMSVCLGVALASASRYSELEAFIQTCVGQIFKTVCDSFHIDAICTAGLDRSGTFNDESLMMLDDVEDPGDVIEVGITHKEQVAQLIQKVVNKACLFAPGDAVPSPSSILSDTAPVVDLLRDLVGNAELVF